MDFKNEIKSKENDLEVPRKGRFSRLLEVRDLASSILVDVEFKKIDENEFINFLYDSVKKQGFTKIGSKKATAWLINQVFKIRNSEENYFLVFKIYRDGKKTWNKQFYQLHEYKIGETPYYLNQPTEETLVIYQSHFFERYKERAGTKNLEEAIFDFMIQYLSKESHPLKKIGSVDGDINMKLPKGIAFGHVTFLGIQKTNLFYFRTFVDNSRLKTEQIEGFAC